MMYGPPDRSPYGPPDSPRAVNSPTILLLVSGLTGVLGFLIGMFAGIGLAEPSASPRKSPGPASTVQFEESEPPGFGTETPVATPGGTGTPGMGTPGVTGTPGVGATPGGTPEPGGMPDGLAGAIRTMIVGTDIQPGTYSSPGPAAGQPGCFWARHNSTEASFSTVIDSGLPIGPATVTIQPTDKAFQTAGCGEWVRVGG
ncbi:hypothetical protein [Nonomuraea sp. NPDC050310]|uniref:hypothetical protein n=1 Tax=Nonomuraea sp. NPDC050310 TaxID=3154935 RepID=UPI0033F6E602